MVERKTWLLLLGLMALLPPQLFTQKNAPPADPRLAGLDSIVLQVLENWKAPGCAIAIVEKGKVLFAGGFGYRNHSTHQPVTEQTLFQIGSCTKAFTCALMGMLDNDGLLSLDGKVQDYLPHFRLHREEDTRRVTVRDLMCHRSGLPRHDLSWLHHPTTRDSFVRRIAYFEPSAELRERWQYNNFGYTALGAIAERVGGRSWEDFIRERLFAPLNMHTARFDLWTLPATVDVACGHRTHADTIRCMDYYRIEGMGPAGSICASAIDMARWLECWVGGGQKDGKAILSPTFVSEALSVQMAMAGSLPNIENPSVFTFGYGLGWILSSYYGHYRAEHGGNINGFSASVCLFPTDSVGIAVMVNQDRSQATAVLRNLLADRLLQLPFRNWDMEIRRQHVRGRLAQISAQQGMMQMRKVGTSPAHPLTSYTGRYHHHGHGTFELVLRNDSLLALTPGIGYYLEHLHYDAFRMIPINEDYREMLTGLNMRLQFMTDLQGEVNEAWVYGIEPEIEKLVFKRQVMPFDVPLSLLERYCGSYLLGTTETKVFLKGKTLIVSVAGQPDYETIPMGEHIFRLKALEGYSIRFEIGEDGMPRALVFLQPNGTFRAVRKK